MTARPYQDLRVARGVVTEGRRECSARYEAIRVALSKLRRPFTVLDLGAAQGYFAERLAEDFGAVVTAVDTGPVRRRKRYPRGSVAWKQERLSGANVAQWGGFDVVLALSLLHHIPDWPRMLEALPTIARRALFLEVPHPEEKLRVAPARGELPRLLEAVQGLGGHVIGRTGGIYDRAKKRELHLVRRPGVRLLGVVSSGGGRHSVFSNQFRGKLRPRIGYLMVPGSLNVRLEGGVDAAALLGPPAVVYVQQRPVRDKQTDCPYHYWPARFGGVAGHVMIPVDRAHGPDFLELIAPVHLRTHLALKDGDALSIEVGA